MTRWLLRLYPRSVRERHGDEIADLLVRSPRRWRDGLDVAHHALVCHLEVIVFRPMRIVLDATTAVLLMAVGFVLNDLEHGIADLPRHWWSSAAVLLAGAVVAVRAVLLNRIDRTGRPS